MQSKVVKSRDFISRPILDVENLLESTNLIWVSTSASLQIEVLMNLSHVKNKTIIIEKPICSDKYLNEKLQEIFLNNSNIKISRPWNFSDIWINFKNEIKSKDKIKNINVEHFGPILRPYLYPPQDWLHHDLCLIQDLGINLHAAEFSASATWSKNNQTLRIAGNDKIPLVITGGYLKERKSRFTIEYFDKTKVELDLNKKLYSIRRAGHISKSNHFKQDGSIITMVEYFSESINDVKNHAIELGYLRNLGILQN